MTTETNAERLEKIKDNCERLARYEKHYGSDDVNITPIVEDLQWLIEQAEKVDELSKEVDNLSNLSIEDERDHYLLRSENDKLREALEFYADDENYNVNTTNQWEPLILINQDHGEKARQALKGTTEDGGNERKSI